MAHIEEFNRTKWAQRSHKQHLKDAHAWRDATTLVEQKKLATLNGVKFSELLELPYWKAVRYALVEAMHVLDLDITQRHVRDLFRIDLEVDGGDGSEPRVERPPRPTPERTAHVLELFHAHHDKPDLLQVLLKNDWVDFKTLWHICNDRDLRVASNTRQRPWLILRVKKWIDENRITREELLAPRPAKQENDLLNELVLTAEQKIRNSARTSPLMDEAQIEICIKTSKALYRGTKFSSIEEEKSTLPPEAVVNRGPVLGYDVMGAIWADMAKTILPSWVGAAPKNWGTAKRGKLSADHWRTIFTIHLPITLIWLWRDETGRKPLLLANMLQLVVAILTANLQTTNAEAADVYDHCYTSYMTEVATLFKENNITPSQHSAFHIGQNLREFGPQHPRSAHHYERYIHHLQRQNTNGKFGEIEDTFLHSTQRMANIKALITDNLRIRSTVSEALEVFDRQSSRVSRGIRLVQILDPTDSDFDLASRSRWSALSVMERQLLRTYLSSKHPGFNLADWEASAIIMDQISLNGARYAKKDVLKYDEDSHIIFRQPTTNQVSPGKILNIFEHWHTAADALETKTTYLVVQRFQVTDLGLGRQDPYQKHPKVFGYLAGAVVAVDLIETAHVQCHFALTPIEFNGLKLIHVFPLNRVDYRHWWKDVYTDPETKDGAGDEGDEDEPDEAASMDGEAMSID
ncbi:hypothetical protein DFH07DRAFT_954069 [Mycena maculata]|uniref:Uncharacterized protein n=1 Tax=Mycena maculata TaxID=230809 RepID=A0AAD7JRA2_9AGAR|nr:hypothetical protein DFH07DRAFT_954069 [Mycena maculata]